ncbi:MAG TPA: imidazolonepropionase [Longimicrobiales bacterium]
MSGTLLFAHPAEVVTGTATDDSGVLPNACVVVRAGRVLEITADADGLRNYPDAVRIDCTGQVITPGFVDSHTHALFGGTRAAEYQMRARGLDYMEIARRGGGINASVSDVRQRSRAELVELTLPRLQQSLAHGTTTIEIKSGYGLSLDAELKMLAAIADVAAATPLDVVPTFLGAHDVPLEFREHRARYVQLVAGEMIPAIAAARLARFCDVFMEPGAFTEAETRVIMQAAVAHGLIPKLHADEFVNSGAAELAVELNAASADHLGAVSERGIAALAASQTVATLLPATLFFLGKKNYAPARRLIDAGATLALATDFNPGTAPSASMPLVLTMAVSMMQMTPLEAIVAASAGGARALRLEDAGVIRAGARADLVVWHVSSHLEIPYHFGSPPVAGVWKAGERVI